MENIKSINILAISTTAEEETSTFVRDSALNFPVFVPKDRHKFESANKISSVPQTILRGENGIVERVWAGLVDSKQEAEIRRLISAPDIHKP